MQISIEKQTGRVILHPLNNAEASESVEIRDVDVEALPEGKGALQWDGEKLVRVPAPQTLPQQLAALKARMPSMMRAKLYALGIQSAYDAGDVEALLYMIEQFQPTNDEERAVRDAALQLKPNPTAVG